MSTRSVIARNLAAAFLTGAWSLQALLDHGTQACGRRDRWLRPLIRRVMAAFEQAPARSSWENLATFIDADAGFQKAWMQHCQDGRSPLHRVFWVAPGMASADEPVAPWPVPALPTTTALADWLALKPAQLDWFADCHGYEAEVDPGPLRHYTYHWLPKASGRWRLLETPRPRLKALQRHLLHGLLDHIPPHAAAHGYRRGRSIATFAVPHCSRRMVLRFDLRQFFPSVRASRVHALFCRAGYSPAVARLLTGLCTNVVPDEVWRTVPDGQGSPSAAQERQCYRYPHLPQGAPTSPALANLCAYRLDCRLHGLAQSLGARYTRYADDLAFSGDRELERCARRFQVQVCRIALEEGFEIHTRKSRFMRQGVRQQLLGIVVNAHPNLGREEYDRLKALLYNCVRLGPTSQNHDGHADFRNHLLGRIAHVALLNASRAQRLRALFQRIRWDGEIPSP
jgi:hypothetical protein